MNATDLFELPSRKFHNSERWWTLLFALLIIYLSKRKISARIPIRICRDWESWHFERYGFLDLSGLDFSNVLTELRLCAEIFETAIRPQEDKNLQPDILILRKDIKKTVLIEVKTLEQSIENRQFEDYLRITSRLRECRWDAECYFLLSMGHEHSKDRNRLVAMGQALILWEDVLRVLDGIDCFKIFFDVNLRDYYEAS